MHGDGGNIFQWDEYPNVTASIYTFNDFVDPFVFVEYDEVL